MRKTKDLTQGPILPHIFKMAIPMLLGLTAHMLLNIVDAMFVGKLGSDELRAVISYAFPIFYIPFAIFQGISTAVAAILSQYLGEKKKEEATNILNQIIVVSLLTCLVLFVVVPLILPLYFKIFNVNPIVAGYSKSYLIIVYSGLLFTSVSFMLGSALRAEGNMRTLAMAMTYGTLINLVLDPFFIFEKFQFLGTSWHPTGLGLGVNGAAWATVIAGIITMIFVVKDFLKKKAETQFPKIPSWSNKDGLHKIFKVGFPAVISHIMMPLMIVGLNFLTDPYGKEAVTAIGIGVRLDILAIFPALSVTTAVISLVGQNFGARNSERINESIKKGYLTGFIVLIFVGAVVYLSKGWLVDIFKPTDSTENWDLIKNSAVHYLGCLSLGYPFIALAMISGGGFQGLGKGNPAMVITVVRVLFFNLLLGFVLSRLLGFGENGVHYAPMIANILMGTAGMMWLLYTIKKTKSFA